MKKTIVALSLSAVVLTGCATSILAPSPAVTSTSIPPTATPTLVPPTATPAPLRVWLDPAVPPAARELASAALAKRATAPASFATAADLRIGIGLTVPWGRWVYVVVVPFPTLADNVQWEDVRNFWAGKAGALATLADDGKTPTLFVTSNTLDVLQKLLGVPNAQAPISVTLSAELVDQAWAARPHAWAIVPFDELEPRWKVLRLDGASVLDKGLDVDKYPLSVQIGAEGKQASELVAALAPRAKLITNRDTERMTVLVMTGVTALVRGIADRMEQKGLLYPAEKIGPLLKEADLTHISNEISFTEECPPPDPHSQSLTFCSSPRYIELLRAVGVDIVELTGNHVKDYGSQAMLDTLKMYHNEGWPYFGGGKDLEEARKPLMVEKNGNKLSFIGCNPVGPSFAWATTDRPGAAPCDYEYVRAELSRLKSQVDVAVMTLQYWEFYQYEPTQQQQIDFRSMVDAGATIVSGSQAHHPQAIEFYHGGFIHYGLGNLFFDQMWSLGTRQQFIDRHVIYKGRHISTELYTYMLEDYGQPRPMSAKERRDLLQAVFQASGW